MCFQGWNVNESAQECVATFLPVWYDGKHKEIYFIILPQRAVVLFLCKRKQQAFRHRNSRAASRAVFLCLSKAWLRQAYFIARIALCKGGAIILKEVGIYGKETEQFQPPESK